MTSLASDHARPASLWPTLWSLGLLVSLALVALIYADGMRVVSRLFAEPEYSHGFLIPLISLYVLWNRRDAIWAERESGSWFGLAIAAFAGLVFIAGEFAHMQRLPWVSLPFMLIAIGVAALGVRAMRRALLPCLLLLAATPLPGSLHVLVSTDLQLISSQLGAAILRFLDIPVYLEGNIIDLGVYKMQVAEACSGLRYLLPLLSFALICAWLMRGPWWARAIVVLSAVPLTVVLNSVRIAMTGVFLHYGSVDAAEGFMHFFEGWIIFLISLVILFVEMWVLGRLAGLRHGFADVLDFDRLRGPEPRVGGEQRVSHPSPWPLLALAALLVVVFAGKLYADERSQIIPPRPPLATFPLQLGEWRGTPGSVERNILRRLGSSDQLLVDYGKSGVPPVNFWIAYYEEQVSDAAIHSPKDCLPAGGWEYVDIRAIEAPIARPDGRSFELNRALISKGSEEMLVYYWVDMRGRQLTNEVYLKIYNLWDSIVMRRSDGALIRFVTPIAEGEDVATADARLQDVLQRAYPHLVPHVAL